MSRPPVPWNPVSRLRLPGDTAIAIPADGFVVYRIVTNEPVKRADFKPISETRAEARSIPEIHRLGLSHYMTVEQALTWRWKEGQHIAKVLLRPDARVHIARTDKDNPGHVEVWGPVSELLANAEIVA